MHFQTQVDTVWKNQNSNAVSISLSSFLEITVIWQFVVKLYILSDFQVILTNYCQLISFLNPERNLKKRFSRQNTSKKQLGTQKILMLIRKSQLYLMTGHVRNWVNKISFKLSTLQSVSNHKVLNQWALFLTYPRGHQIKLDFPSLTDVLLFLDWKGELLNLKIFYLS